MEMSSSRIACVACHHEIDAAARLCPYCGADPRTGEKIDTAALLQEEFKLRQTTTSESVIEYARQRQGLVVALGIAAAVLLLLALHQFATHRNETAVSSMNAVPLAEVTDVAEPDAQQTPPMPELKFQYDGQPQTMRTFVVEPGAVTPPEVLAAQQAAAAAQKPAAPTPPPPRASATQRPAATQLPQRH